MDIKQTKQKPCTQLIQQLKSQGLYLTQQKKIKLPLCINPSPSIVTRIMSLISNQQKVYDINSPKKIWPLEQNLVLITQCNTLSSYTLLKKQDQSIDAQQKQKFHMQETINCLVFAYYQNMCDVDTLYFIILYENCNLMSLFSIKNRAKQDIVLEHQIRASSDVMTLQFISRYQFLIVTSKHAIYHYKIQKSRLKMINQINQFSNLAKLEPNDNIIFIKLLARPREEQDSLIAIFYATWNSQTNKCQLNIKQMFRQLDGNIILKDAVYNLMSFISAQSLDDRKDKSRQISFYSKEHLKEVQIVNQREYFLLKLNYEIFVITKHFNKYVRLDSITQNLTSFKILMIEHHVPLICCIGLDCLQLWHITVDTKKSNCTLMDVINLRPDNKLKQSQFLRFWVMNYQNKIQTIFAFDRGGRNIGFFGVKKIDKVSKLVNRIVNTTQKNQILKAQQLGKKLGVDRKSLYLKLWNDNPKNPANIYLYLLQSHDLPSIHSQLQKYMKRKFISTGELIKIHTEIENILLQKLTEELNFKTLKWYLKTNFQKRKLNLFSFTTQITFKDFQDIYEASIFDLIHKNTRKKIQPQKIQSKSNWNTQKPNDPQINVYHILQEFRLLILQNYEQFLLKTLQYYKYDSARFLKHFYDFLPKAPFKIEVFTENINLNAQVAAMNGLNSKNEKIFPYSQELSLKHLNSNVKDFKQDNIAKQQKQLHDEIKQYKESSSIKNISQRDEQKELSLTKRITQINEQSKFQLTNDLKDQSNLSSQKNWFIDITKQQWTQQKSSVDYIFNILYPHYQTHQIMNLLTQLTQSEWNTKNKYTKHCLISTTKNTFKQRITKIQGIKLYLSVCQFVNRVKFDAIMKIQGESMTKDILFYICKEANVQHDLQVKQQSQIFQTSKYNLQKNIVSQAPKILEIMKQNKLLTGDGYETCLLYSKMHDLMISKQIIDPHTTIVELMTKSHSSLIAAFFIGKKQRNAQLFNDLFPLYNNKYLFYQSLSEYINSPSCSRVELQILVRQLHDLKTEHQEYNNYLADLLIHGFCLRTQIRQKYQAHEIVSMFSEIGLKLDLALKMQKFIAIKNQLTFIFQFFKCQKLSYEKVLNQPQKVIKQLMQNYFNGELNEQILKAYNLQIFTIQGRQIDLQIIQNTFSVMLYLRQKLYVQLSQLDLSLIYGQIMIDWEQFDILKTIFSNDQISPNEQFSSIQYFEKLIVKALSQIYTKQNIYMDQKTITHIQNILSLLGQESSNPLIIRQRAKLQISKLLEDWGWGTYTVTLQLICLKWKQQNRQGLMLQIMDNCIQYFDLEALQKLYRLLQTTRKGSSVRDVRNDESIRLAYKLAEKLAAYQNDVKTQVSFDNKNQQISKIIYFINKNQIRYVVELGLMAQTFLRMTLKKYSQDPRMIQNDLRSEFIDYKKQDIIRQEALITANNFLSVRKPSYGKLHKSFQTGGQNNIQKIRDTSFHFKDKSSYNYEFKSNSGGPQGSRMSNKSRINQIQDPINALKFDDPLLIQRVFNHLIKTQTQISISNICKQLTVEKPWYLNGKQMIQYFIIHWANPQIINQMFRNKFSRQIWQQNETKHLTVSKDLCYKIEQSFIEPYLYNQSQRLWMVNLDLQLLWNVSTKVCKTYIHNYIQVLKHRVKQFSYSLSQKYCKILYYGHFFLLMALKSPQSLTKLHAIDYDHIVNLQLIYQLEMQAKKNKKQLQRINFEQIWKNYYKGLKSLLILKLQQMQTQLKIPQNIQTKILQRLINELGKQKTQLALYIKILARIQLCISKYIKQQKPKVLNDLKNIFESMLVELNSSSPLMIKKNTKQPRRFSNDLKITLRQIQQAKQVIKQLSRNQINDGVGLMKQIADVFQDFKKSQNIEDYQESLKDVIVKRIMSKRQLNMSSFFLDKQEKHHPTPFQSSIVLQNKLFTNNVDYNQQSSTPNKSIFTKQNNKQQRNNNSFQQIQYFKSQKFQFDSDIGLNDKQQQSDYQDDFLNQHHHQNFQNIINKSNLPYLNILYPENITKILATKDGKFQKNYHLNNPLSEEFNTLIKDFARLLNGYQVYSNKNSKYYMEENVKKMLNYSSKNILQIIQQIYFEDDSILVTLNPKQFEANNIRRAKGLGCQQQKYKKAKLSFILILIKSLNLITSNIFISIVENIKKRQDQIMQMYKDDESKQNIEIRKQFQQDFKQQMKLIFPLSDLSSQQPVKTYKQQLQIIFGRIYLSKISTNDSLKIDIFKMIVQLIVDILSSLSNHYKEQNIGDEVEYSKLYDDLASTQQFNQSFVTNENKILIFSIKFNQIICSRNSLTHSIIIEKEQLTTSYLQYQNTQSFKYLMTNSTQMVKLHK